MLFFPFMNIDFSRLGATQTDVLVCIPPYWDNGQHYRQYLAKCVNVFVTWCRRTRCTQSIDVGLQNNATSLLTNKTSGRSVCICLAENSQGTQILPMKCHIPS